MALCVISRGTLEGAAEGCTHKVRIYKEYHSVCQIVNSSELGLSQVPNPSLASECAPPPRTGGGGSHTPAVRGWGVPIPTTGEKA
jgi:hypothetical protein